MLVVAAVGDRPCNVAQYALHCIEMLGGGLLYQLAHVANSEGDVSPHVHQVLEVADQAPILGGIHFWSRSHL
jgi:hypothetical protein